MTSPASDAADAVRDARARLRHSLDALSDHISPGGALDLARSIVEDHEARRSAVDFVKRNPVPTALAASGLAWLGYKLLSGDDARLADPRHEPGLTEVSGESNVVPGRATSGRQDVPRVAALAPEVAQHEEPAVRPPAKAETSAGLRATFARHPLLYGVVGLVAGAITGVIAALRGGRDSELDAPGEAPRATAAASVDAKSPAPAGASTTCAHQGPVTVNGFTHPARPDGPHAWTN